MKALMSKESSRNPAEGHRARLRKRFERSGFQGFAEHEVIELLLTLCIPRRDVKEPARKLIKKYKTMRGVLEAQPEELRQIEGIGEVAPVALSVIREAATLYLLEQAEGDDVYNSVDKLAAFWRARLAGLRHEVFEVAYLDNGYRLLRDGVERLQSGTVDRSVVYPREIVAAALRREASAIVLAHNHPGGSLKPSEQDQQLTDQIVHAAVPLGLRVVDHLIITTDSFFSFRREGLI